MNQERRTGDRRAGEPIRVAVPDYVYPLIPTFLENRRRDIAAIEEALSGRDYATIRLLGHRMRGDGGSYGLDRVGEIGAGLERAALDGDGEATRQHLQELEDFLARLEVINRRE